jgi:hypothetical protein
MNISKSEIAGECKLKCAFNFNYSSSTCKINNQLVTGNCDGSLGIQYDNAKAPPVTYNGNKYNIATIMLTRCSAWVQIRNQCPLGFLAVGHAPVLEGKRLVVLVPIVIGTPTQGGSLLSKIITETLKVTPTGGSATLNIPEFTLNTLIPSKPFFTFSTKEEFIVYDTDYAIPIPEEVMNNFYNITYKEKKTEAQLSKIYKTAMKTPPFFPKSPLFYNSWGANSIKSQAPSSGKDDIYIECNPVNQSDAEEPVKMGDYAASGGGGGTDLSQYFSETGMNKLIEKPWFQGVLIFIAVLLLLAIVVWILKYLKPALSVLSTQQSTL